MTVTLTIPGLPKPKGSMRCLGRVGKVRHQLAEDFRPGQRDWRDRITDTVRTRVHTHAEHGEPVHVHVVFTLPRPTSHYGTGRNSGILRKAASTIAATSLRTGDVDKLARLVLDALEDGGLLDNDAQVVDLHTRKVYRDTPDSDALPYTGARITVTFPTREPAP